MNARELLVKIYSTSNNEIKRNISEKFLQCFENNNFLPLKEIADACYVSESTITKFCKKIGYEGFIDFSLRLKFERENYKKLFEQSFEKTAYTEFRQYINNYLDKIDQNKEILENFFTKNKGKKINIITSNQTNEYGMMLDYLNNKNGVSSQYNYFKSPLFGFDYKTKNEIFIIMCAGYDVEMVIRSYEHFKVDNEILVLCSNARASVFNESLNKIVVDFSNSSTPFYLRNLMIHYLCIQISNSVS